MRNDREIQGMGALAFPFQRRELTCHLRHDLLCKRDIRIQIRHNHVNGHRFKFGMPAVVIGHHCHRGVTEPGFPRQFRFGHIGHADHIQSPLTVHGIPPS